VSCFSYIRQRKGKVLAAQEHNSKASNVNRKEKLQFSVTKLTRLNTKTLMHSWCFYTDPTSFSKIRQSFNP
jgi:hypothetical protein